MFRYYSAPLGVNYTLFSSTDHFNQARSAGCQLSDVAVVEPGGPHICIPTENQVSYLDSKGMSYGYNDLSSKPMYFMFCTYLNGVYFISSSDILIQQNLPTHVEIEAYREKCDQTGKFA